jgi:phytoene dehydrogenase-like protein
MSAIPNQLAKAIPSDSIRLGHGVHHVSATGMVLNNGEYIAAKRVVVATDAPAQARLIPGLAQRRGRSAYALHLAVPQPAPIAKPWLILPGDSQGPIASISFPSLVVTGYAPAGFELATVAVLEDHGADDLWSAVQTQLRQFFGDSVDQWYLLHQDFIKQALPAQGPEDLSPEPIAEHNGIILCGDCQSRPGIGPALASGFAAAERVLQAE